MYSFLSFAELPWTEDVEVPKVAVEAMTADTSRGPAEHTNAEANPLHTKRGKVTTNLWGTVPRPADHPY